MSFLRSRPPVQSNRAHQQRALGVRPSPGGPAVKREIPTKKPAAQPQPGTYTDYKLVSTSHDVLHHVMRFHGNKEVSPDKFTQPVKLHRKRNENSGYNRYSYYNSKYNYQNKDTAGADKKDGVAGGNAAAGPGGAAAPTTGADTSLIAPYGGGVRNKQMLFKKRTRQIYIANEEERKKKEIEAAPWVVEDYDNQNNWTGQLEGGQHANYVLFLFSDDGFKVVPADKWYKFTPKIQYATLTAEEAEEQYQKAQKQNNSSIRWLMRSKNKAKTEDGEEGAEEEVEGEHLVTVDHEDDVGYDEDEARERKKKRGKHGDVDEMDFDEVWQDDEEMPSEMPGFEDDAKDDPRRKQGPAMDSDEDEDEEDDKGRLTETGKAVKKALLKLEKNKVYASDDEKDPYASDQDSSDSDLDEIDKEKDTKKEDDAQLSQETAKSKGKGKASVKGALLIPKKAGVTKSATPNKPVGVKALKGKVPLPPPRNASAGAKPAVSSSSPSLSTVAGKAVKSSLASSSVLRASSPPAPVAGGSSSSGTMEKKRKKTADSAETVDEGPSRKQSRTADAAPFSGSSAQADASAGGDDSLLITEAEVIALLKSRPQVTTRDLIVDLKRKLRKEPRNKNILAAIVKKVAIPQDGILVLKEGL
ncbi:hypothetical protein BC939DRAFT_505853 [Gamsiella multidivaricata]|uniref:uncharacterized protein n=1 Tax=Gamsiella multidivaricata TaxID=101098 RepID=UPI00222019FA|nr:uncharacterized protein BC939DRAFT_505853 [Gamsiella multidivaricata]KAG0370884.1 hypothetical protein BGZ54_003014 [Gamsiella multidivaricata]KAI7819344.1 hypothetical protein BC939DRAFT_505853 [Gamsiella multidivaricata]